MFDLYVLNLQLIVEVQKLAAKKMALSKKKILATTLDLKPNTKFIDNKVTAEEFQRSTMLTLTNDVSDIANCNIFIVTVPTPIDEYKQPNLMPLITASETVGKFLQKDDLVIYESTVYPGATEEVCIPILPMNM